jgi:hypothetical protein
VTELKNLAVFRMKHEWIRGRHDGTAQSLLAFPQRLLVFVSLVDVIADVELSQSRSLRRPDERCQSRYAHGALEQSDIALFRDTFERAWQ